MKEHNKVFFFFFLSFKPCIISVAISAAEPGLAVDTDAQVGVQSGAAPTAEGKDDLFKSG